MKKSSAVLGLLFLLAGGAAAQNPPIPPFYQVYGGLFYPGYDGFRSTFDAPSDFVWGMGMGLPVSEDFLYVVADISWFRAKAFTPGTPDVNTELSENFWHLGLMNKYYVARTLAVRFQGGLNLNTVERRVTPAGGTEVRTELPRKLGFFGGLGLENMLAGGQLAIFADAVYDYRRSTERDLHGDMGGVRVVAGIAVYWF